MAKLLLVLGTLLARGARGYVSLQDLAREVGLPPSTVHRILRLCVAHGMVIQSRDQRYSVGPSLLAVGMSAAEEWGLRTVAQSALKELAGSVREEAYLTMRVGYAGIFIERAASPRPIRVIEPLFERLPLHCGASRKVLLANSSTEFIEEYLAQGQLQRFTDNTITDPIELREELAKIRAQGFGTSDGERSAEVAGVAAPVHGPWGHVLASVSMLAPAALIRGERRDELISSVRGAAGQISDRLRIPPEMQSERAGDRTTIAAIDNQPPVLTGEIGAPGS